MSTVRLTAEMPMPNFDRITAADLPIIQKKQWEGVTEPRSFTDIGIGTGPYRLVEYVADEYYRFEANENYWRGAPVVKHLDLVTIKDPQTMFTALRTGEIDGAARPVPPELVVEWRDNPALEMISSPTLWGAWLDINVAREPFDNKRLRRAISLGVDTAPMLETIMLGQGKPGIHAWPHVDSFWTKPDLHAPYDPEAAMAILDEEGFVDTDSGRWPGTTQPVRDCPSVSSHSRISRCCLSPASSTYCGSRPTRATGAGSTPAAGRS